ncbi:acyltransferase family protein [Sphingomonas sp. PB4P5]|uniref:acyltransferase family protein n=1 Tax=Parasphingomonas puruogangriensis TaxID=3096155 RepID=UPI002FCA0C3F
MPEAASADMHRGPELRALTSVRGIAAWFVVLFHIRFAIAGLPDSARGLLAKGYLAVDFFFLLSGFVIWLSWGDRLHRERWRAVPGFLRKRIARIWPLHLVMLALTVLLALTLVATGRAEPDNYPFAQLPLHIQLLQNWGFTERLTWNDPSWSISAEFGAYLLFPLLALAVDWRRWPSWAVVTSIAMLCGLLHLIMASFGAITLNGAIPRLGLLRCLVEFAAGTAICALWVRWKDAPAIPAAFAALAAACIAMLWLLGLAETLVVPALFAALLLLLALTAGMKHNPLDLPALHYLGEISYATYLGHFMLWVVFKLVFISDPRNVSLPLIVLFLLLVLLSSIALYHGVERPAQRWVNKKFLPGTGRWQPKADGGGGPATQP